LAAAQLAAAARVLGVSLSAFFYEGVPAGPKGDALDHERWMTVRRPLKVLSCPDFAQVAPLIGLWSDRRGQLTDDVEDALLTSGILARVIILRRPPKSSRLVTQHFGSRIVFVRPSDIVGRDIQDLPDPNYGELVAQAYDEVLWHRQPVVYATRAIIRTWDGKTIDARYDRVLVPWRWRGSDQFAMCISLRRGHLTEMDSAVAMLPP
jgi:hypothetical protein